MKLSAWSGFFVCTAKIFGMNELIFIVRDSPEGGFEAEALGHDIFTEADSFEELKEMLAMRWQPISRKQIGPE